MLATRCTEADVLGLHQCAAVSASRGGSWLVQGFDIAEHGDQVME